MKKTAQQIIDELMSLVVKSAEQTKESEQATEPIDQLDNATSTQMPFDEPPVTEQLDTDTLSFELDDMVKFTDDEGIDRVGVVEAVDLDGKLATVRVMAVTGDITEPTDMVLNMAWDALSAYDESGSTATPEDSETMQDLEDDVEPDEAGSTDASGNLKGLVVGDFVSFVTLDGRTKGMVTSVAEQTAHIEVYALAGKEYEATGVIVSHDMDILTRIDTPQIAEQKRKIVAKFTDVQTKEMDTDAGQMGYIYGDGSVYGNTDLGGDIVPKGAFTQTLTHNNGIFQSYWDHGWTTETLAGVAVCTDADRSLKTEIRVPLWIDKCRQNYEQVKFQLSQGAKMGLSIGYDPIKTSPGANGTRYLNEIKLLEVSVTPMPMNTQALIESVKSRKAVYAQKADRWKQRPATITAPKAPNTTKSNDAPVMGSQVAHDDAQDWALVIAELKQLTSLVTSK
jgi:uncharacterized protein